MCPHEQQARPTLEGESASIAPLTHKVAFFSDQLDERRRQLGRPETHPQLLILTTAACQGVDLARSDQAIHYDVPWNPHMLQQRIGELERIGTAATRIHYHFLQADQAGQEPLAIRLLEKVEQYERALGWDLIEEG